MGTNTRDSRFARVLAIALFAATTWPAQAAAEPPTDASNERLWSIEGMMGRSHGGNDFERWGTLLGARLTRAFFSEGARGFVGATDVSVEWDPRARADEPMRRDHRLTMMLGGSAGLGGPANNLYARAGLGVEHAEESGIRADAGLGFTVSFRDWLLRGENGFHVAGSGTDYDVRLGIGRRF